jgi:hypothetical protein
MANKIQEANSSQKQLDPPEDEGLTHFLKFNKHLENQTSNQIKRIEGRALKFRLVKNPTNNEFDLEIKKAEKYLLYPKQSDRINIIKHYHFLGHFKSETALNRIKEKLYWKKMAEDVQALASKCAKCHEGSVVADVHHPAKAIVVAGVGDLVGIDLSFGYEMTDDGYHGLLITVECVNQNQCRKLQKTCLCTLEFSARQRPISTIMEKNGK